jgi:hypothetical protein
MVADHFHTSVGLGCPRISWQPVNPEDSLEKRNHCEKTSHALLVGPILHVLSRTAAILPSWLAPRSPETIEKSEAAHSQNDPETSSKPRTPIAAVNAACVTAGHRTNGKGDERGEAADREHGRGLPFARNRERASLYPG